MEYLRPARSAVLVIGVTLASTGVQAQLSNDNSPWEMFAARLMKRLSVSPGKDGAVSDFQLVKSPVLADWADPKFGAASFYTFAAYLSKSGEFFSPSGDLTLHGQYKLFLSSLDLPPSDPKLQDQLDTARKTWTDSLKAFDALDDERNKAWARRVRSDAAVPEERRMPYDIWYEREYGPKTGALKQAVTEKAYQYARLLADTYKGYSGLGTLITGLDTNVTNVKFPSGEVREVPRFSYDVDLADFKTKGDEGKGFQETWEFKQSHERRSLTWSKRGGGGGGKIGWFRFRGGGGSSSQTLDTTKNGIEMTVKFMNFTTVTITPARWYDGNVIKALWDSPYKAGAIQNKDKLFGADGSFWPRVARAVVVYKPSIELKLDASTYNKAVQSWNGGGGIGIGPFSFKGGANGGSDTLVEDKANNRLFIEDKTGIPQVVAVYLVNYPQ